MLPTIDEIASATRASRAEFGRLFLQVQVDFVVNPAERVLFEAVGQSAVDVEAFKQALQYAQAQGWLASLVEALVKEGLEDGRLAQAMVKAATDATGDAALQAVTNAAAGFAQPEIMFRGLASGMRWTVKVLIDGASTGTGILIGPHLVLTAWHVVRALFRPAAAGGWEPNPDAAARLKVEFDDFLALVAAGGVVGAARTIRVDAHKDWCVVFSRCHEEELNSRLPDDPLQLEGFWDYAVIRLAKTPGIERRWAALDARAVVPKAAARILVFQHPAGQPMRLDQGEIVPAEAAVAAAVPRLRFLHGANAVGGSSGGPCFDKTFMLFGFHQGQWVRGGGGNGPVINRGIPLARVLEHIKTQIPELPSPDPSENPIWNLGPAENYPPVIGCDAFQTLVWRSALSGSPKILVVNGKEASGKTFRLAVLSTMLSDAGHLKIALKGTAISKLEATKLAERICRTAGAAPPAFVSNAEFSSTTSAWIRDELVQKMLGAIDAVRNGRLAWISIEELNKTDIQGENASDFLIALYEQVRTVGWLRIVLDAPKADVPVSVRSLRDRHSVEQPTVDDIRSYVRRAVVEIGDVPDERAIRISAVQAERDFREWIGNDAATAMTLLKDRARQIVDDYFEE